MDFAAKLIEFSANVEEQPTNLNGRVLLVDGLNTYLRSFAAAPTMNEDGAHVGGLTGFLLSVGAAIRQFKPTRVVICFDGKGGSQRRKELFPEYKAKRKVMTKLNRTYDFASLEEEKDAQKWQLKSLIALLSYLPVTLMAPELVEADDVIAYIAQYVEEQHGKAIIMSSDKDFLQLVNENISVYSPIRKKHYHEDGVTSDYGFHPHNFLLYRTITGDNSDCIPGVDGIKEKTLLKYFPELANTEKRSIQYLLDKAKLIEEERGKKTPVAIKTLLASNDLLERNLRLMRLDDVAMSSHTRIKVLDRMESPISHMSKYEFHQLAASLKILGAFSNFDSWFINTWAALNRTNKQVNE